MIECPICGPSEWLAAYRGPIRMGVFPVAVTDRIVEQCASCGVRRLSGGAIDYESERYRELVDTDPSAAAFHRKHDAEQPERVAIVGADRLRDKIVVDVGAGAGSFLDAIRGMAARTIAIEPARHFQDELARKGHEIYAYASDALPRIAGQADVVTAFAVVEHVEDPASFVAELAQLARPGAMIVLSTPNVRDWLIDACPAYAGFFYRVVHRWYFDAQTLGRLARKSGIEIARTEYRHRFDLSNALCWLRDQRPTGLGSLPALAGLDATYRHHVESLGRSDYLYLIGSKV